MFGGMFSLKSENTFVNIIVFLKTQDNVKNAITKVGTKHY